MTAIHEIKQLTSEKTTQEQKRNFLQQLTQIEAFLKSYYKQDLERKGKVTQCSSECVQTFLSLDQTENRILISERFKKVYFEFIEIYHEYQNQKYKLADYQEIFQQLLNENQQFLNQERKQFEILTTSYNQNLNEKSISLPKIVSKQEDRYANEAPNFGPNRFQNSQSIMMASMNNNNNQQPVNTLEELLSRQLNQDPPQQNPLQPQQIENPNSRMSQVMMQDQNFGYNNQNPQAQSMVQQNNIVNNPPQISENYTQQPVLTNPSNEQFGGQNNSVEPFQYLQQQLRQQQQLQKLFFQVQPGVKPEVNVMPKSPKQKQKDPLSQQARVDQDTLANAQTNALLVQSKTPIEANPKQQASVSPSSKAKATKKTNETPKKGGAKK